MIETIFLTLISVCLGVVLLSLFMIYKEKTVVNSHLNSLKVPANIYANLVIDWCLENLNSSSKKVPHLKISRRITKNTLGAYRPYSNEIIIYIKKHMTLLELTNTVIHEFVHSTQNGKRFGTNYDAFNKSVGYLKNPFEIESRSIANSKDKECLMSLHHRFKIL